MKRILIVLAILALLALVGGILTLDRAVAASAERAGSYALGVETRLGGADVGVFAGKLGVDRLSVANPAGFEGSFLEVADFDLDIDVGSLLSDTIVVQKILVDGVELSLRRLDGETNYGKILENLGRFESGDAPPPAEDADTGSGKTLDIGLLEITNLHATVDFNVLGGESQRVEVTVPEIRVEEVGQDMSVADVYNLFVKTILTSVLESGASDLPAQLLEDLGGRLGNLSSVSLELLGNTADELGSDVDEVVEQVGEQADEVVEGVEDKVDEAKEKAQDALKGIGDKAGGLFGKDKGDG